MEIDLVEKRPAAASSPVENEAPKHYRLGEVLRMYDLIDEQQLEQGLRQTGQNQFI